MPRRSSIPDPGPSLSAARRTGIVLGVHVGHDRSAALVKEGVLLCHVAQERLDRVKMSSGSTIPFAAIDAVLKQSGYKIADVDAIGFTYENCAIDRFARHFSEDLAFHYEQLSSEVIPVDHHLAHAWSGFALSGFQRAAILVSDGAGDLVYPNSGTSSEAGMQGDSLFLGVEGKIELVEQRLQSFHLDIFDRPFLYYSSKMPDTYRSLEVSIGRKYEQFTYFLGFGYEENGKTMGLSSYGQPLFEPERWPVRDFSYNLSLAAILDDIEILALQKEPSLQAFLRNRRADVASTVQRFTEEALLGIVRHARSTLDESALCLSGGVFLNCVANHKIARTGIYDRMFIMPAAGDEGHAVGAAFAVAINMTSKWPRPKTGSPSGSKRKEHDQDGSSAEGKTYERPWKGCVGGSEGEPRVAPEFPYVGLEYSRDSIEWAIRRNNLAHRWLEDVPLAEAIAALIETGSIVGVLRGRAELGPRALGHRSILADPRSPTIKDRLNQTVKFREAFRPYAPMVTLEHATEIFDLVAPSPFMLFACDVHPEWHERLPAITHVDGSARIQTVDRARDPFLHALLLAFRIRTGVPVLLNTSFNLAGEPIVEDPEDAIRTFLSCGMDALVIGGALIEKKGARRLRWKLEHVINR